MEVKIGVIHANRELTLESNQSVDDVQKAVSDALTPDGGLFSLTDDKGRTVYVPAEKLAYVEIAGGPVRKVGFGAT
ncbi:MAG: DUF3107 domain-containing protein [Nocardioidaceae bacterium]